MKGFQLRICHIKMYLEFIVQITSYFHCLAFMIEKKEKETLWIIWIPKDGIKNIFRLWSGAVCSGLEIL